MSDSALPPAVLRPTILDVFNIRNNPGELSARQRQQFLCRIKFPPVREPEAFANYLLELEDEIGTWRAALLGMIFANPGMPRFSVLQAVEILEQAAAIVPPGEGSAAELEALQDKVGRKLLFTPNEEDVFAALSNFQANLAGQKLPLGHCVFPAGFKAFMWMARGYLAGEGHEVDKYHSFAVLATVDKGPYIFHVWGNEEYHEQDLHEFEAEPNHVLCNAFGFVSAYVLFSVLLSTHHFGRYMLHPRDAADDLMRLDLAEALNPYNSKLYRLRAQIYLETGDDNLMRQNSLHSQALQELEDVSRLTRLRT